MTRLSSLVLAGAAFVALVQTTSSHAQSSTQSAALEKKLITAKKLDCTFSTLATGNWDGAKTTATVAAAKLEVKFMAIDVDEGTAEADGGFGAALIIVRYSHGYLHLMQMSDAGPLYITTVLATPSANGRFKAMHTRHEWSPAVVPGFTSRPEMYVGDCAVAS
jgi:glucose/arabinose dehydrogenase